MCEFIITSLQVVDQFLNFIAIEDDMFILREYQSDLISYQGVIIREEISCIDLSCILYTSLYACDSFILE